MLNYNAETQTISMIAKEGDRTYFYRRKRVC